MVDGGTLRRDTPASRAERALERWIVEGLLPGGSELPTEVELARRLGCSRTPLRRALANLSDQGRLIRSGHRWKVADGERLHQQRCGLVALLTPEHVDRDLLVCRGTATGQHLELGLIEGLLAQGLSPVLVAPGLLGPQILGPHWADLLAGAVVMARVAESGRIGGFLADLQRELIPLVYHGDGLDRIHGDRVRSDHAAGCALLVQELHALGCRRILRVWDRNPAESAPGWLRERNAGYASACTRLGLPCLPACEVPVPASLDFAGRAGTVARALTACRAADQAPDAVLALNDGTALHVAEALRQLGLPPNRRVAVAGYDGYAQDSIDFDKAPCAPLITIDKDNLGMGRELAAVLAARIAAPTAPLIERVMAPRVVVDAQQQAAWLAARQS